MWEPYDDSGNQNGGWDIGEDINQNIGDYIKIPTWRNVARTSYCILNNLKWSETKVKPDISETLRSIAFINVSKYPGEHTSPNRWKYLEGIYEKTKNVLLKQIEYCAPSIIIGGNILYLFTKDLDLKEDDKSFPSFGRSIWEKRSSLFIDAYHPNRYNRAYCDELIDVATKWIEQTS